MQRCSSPDWQVVAEAWSTLEDIEIAGVVMCLRDGNGTEAGLLGTSASASSAAALELHCQMKKITRDHNHQVFGSMMKEKLIMVLKGLCSRVEVGDPQKIIWQWLLEFIRRNSLIIINWPLGVPPPGPGFEYKKLKADALCQLVVPYLQRKLGSMCNGQSDDNDDKKNNCLDGVLEVKIKPWNEGIVCHEQRDAHPLKGEIALVKAPDGMVLCKVSDDPEWQKSHEEEDPGMVAPHAQSGIQFPLHKQAHVDVTDNDSVPCEDPGPSQQFPPSWHYEVLPPAHCGLGHFPLSCQMYHIPSHPDHHVYHDAPYISDYYPPALPTAQQWVDRGSAAKYEDKFPEDYLDY
ncbi:hypothetical protein F5J12DRAFT_787486 [Pisolithus orientalis]|uniref:uncharacterized protein n=1 Tax=Pisolithus orientalis TaxID=936130 RepID=UPI002225714A|nr:uncharacterized protein F5J12DRAFT_787486 [Pisolithus orientalis]KAI5984965.1 hypothetical protein F5J12DRAFT_787486 [Pisolithus orientalis]